jgi:thermitase
MPAQEQPHPRSGSARRARPRKLRGRRTGLLCGALAAAAGSMCVSTESAARWPSPPPLATIVHHASAGNVPDRQRWIIPGEEIVTFRNGLGAGSMAAIARATGIRVIESFPLIHSVVVAVPKDGEHAIAWIRRTAGVVGVEPNVLEQPMSVACGTSPQCPGVNDPLYRYQWYLENDRATVEPPGGRVPGADIDAPLGWRLDRGSRSIRIAIVDSGIDLTHPDVAPRVVAAATLVVNNGDVTDKDGHGTAIAGVAAAIPNNHIGIAGVAYNASLVDIKITSDVTASDTASCAALADGVAAAAAAGAQVINVSFGSPLRCTVVQAAVTEAWDAGHLVVASAGNGASNQPMYPAAYDDVISVGATNSHNRRAWFSSYGAGWVDLAAPGVNIMTTLLTRPNRYGPANYGFVTGTSITAPMVSGAAALLFAQGLNNRQVASRLFAYAKRIPGTGRYWRYGLLDVCRSIAAGQPLCRRPRSRGPIQAHVGHV